MKAKDNVVQLKSELELKQEQYARLKAEDLFSVYMEETEQPWENYSDNTKGSN